MEFNFFAYLNTTETHKIQTFRFFFIWVLCLSQYYQELKKMYISWLTFNILRRKPAEYIFTQTRVSTFSKMFEKSSNFLTV